MILVTQNPIPPSVLLHFGFSHRVRRILSCTALATTLVNGPLTPGHGGLLGQLASEELASVDA